MLQWLGLNDAKSVAALIVSILLLVLLLWTLPHWLNGQAHSDFAGTAIQTASGDVTLVTISPVSQGGGGLFNAIGVTFAGHQQYYALPKTSKWDPKYGDKVTVRYQIGRTGRVQLDSVLPVGS